MKPRFSKVTQLAQGNAAGKWQSGDLIPGCLIPGLLYLIAGFTTAPSGNEEAWEVFKAKQLGCKWQYAATAGHHPVRQNGQHAGPRLAAGSMIVMRLIMGVPP